MKLCSFAVTTSLWFIIFDFSSLCFAADIRHVDDIAAHAEEKGLPEQYISGRPGRTGFNLKNLFQWRLPKIMEFKNYSEKAKALSENPRLEYVALHQLRVFNPHFVSWKYTKMENRAKVLASSDLIVQNGFSKDELDELVPSNDPIYVVSFSDPILPGGRRYFVVEGQGRILSLKRALNKKISTEESPIWVEVTLADLCDSARDEIMTFRRLHLDDNE